MRSGLLALSLFFISTSALAATLTTPANHQMTWHLPDGWEIATSLPEALLAETVRSLAAEAREHKAAPTPAQLEQAARNRLAANELLLFHPQSGAWIGFDFSPLHQGEAQPTRESLQLSARYALESLQNEAGIELLDSEHRSLSLPGAADTRLILARYLKGESETLLQGLVGALPGEWFYIYATSYPGKADLAQIEELFKQLAFTP